MTPAPAAIRRIPVTVGIAAGLLAGTLGTAAGTDQADPGPRIDTLPNGRVVVTNRATGLVVEAVPFGRP